MRPKRLPSMSLVVALAAGVAACDSGQSDRTTQRDVYGGPKALENCIADWGNADLCKQTLTKEEGKKLANSTTTHSRSPGFFFLGPGFFGGNRTVTHQGVPYTPTANRAVSTARVDSNLRPVSFGTPHPPGVSARGGFGNTGRGYGGTGG